MEVLGYEKLWTGSFPYGDGKDDIENYLKTVNFENKYGADIARLRILQTGHGINNFENCAEFCNKYRNIFYDEELIDHKNRYSASAQTILFILRQARGSLTELTGVRERS